MAQCVDAGQPFPYATLVRGRANAEGFDWRGDGGERGVGRHWIGHWF
jgi:hypothetical protein